MQIDPIPTTPADKNAGTFLMSLPRLAEDALSRGQAGEALDWMTAFRAELTKLGLPQVPPAFVGRVDGAIIQIKLKRPRARDLVRQLREDLLYLLAP